MPTTQLNVRVDRELKRLGDSALARLGVSASDVVRALWEYLAQAQELPPFMNATVPTGVSEATAEAEAKPAQTPDGAGMALSLARDRGLATPDAPDIQGLSYQELRDFAFEELVEEGGV